MHIQECESQFACRISEISVIILCSDQNTMIVLINTNWLSPIEIIPPLSSHQSQLIGSLLHLSGYVSSGCLTTRRSPLSQPRNGRHQRNKTSHFSIPHDLAATLPNGPGSIDIPSASQSCVEYRSPSAPTTASFPRDKPSKCPCGHDDIEHTWELLRSCQTDHY